MKSIKYGLATALLAGAFTTPALADVDLLVEVWKKKDVDINETILIDKDIIIDIEVEVVVDADAEGWVLANQTSVFNDVGRDVGDAEEEASNSRISRTDLIDGSINGNSGGVGVNQDSGNMVNQANVVSYGLTGDDDAIATSNASADQFNILNDVQWGPVPDNLPDDIDITASMTNSVNRNSGIVGVNQNAGNMNNQLNGVAIAIGLGPDNSDDDDAMVALAEADLGQFNALNVVNEVNSTKSATISGSISGASGVTGVNQAIGSNSNQANIVSISVTLEN